MGTVGFACRMPSGVSRTVFYSLRRIIRKLRSNSSGFYSRADYAQYPPHDRSTLGILSSAGQAGLGCRSPGFMSDLYDPYEPWSKLLESPLNPGQFVKGPLCFKGITLNFRVSRV